MGDHTVGHRWFGTMLPSQQLLHLEGSSLASGAPMGGVSCCFHSLTAHVGGFVMSIVSMSLGNKDSTKTKDLLKVF